MNRRQDYPQRIDFNRLCVQRGANQAKTFIFGEQTSDCDESSSSAQNAQSSHESLPQSRKSPEASAEKPALTGASESPIEDNGE